MSSPVADLLRDLARALDRVSLRWYLFGAQAALIYGAARLTADVDVTVDWPAARSPAPLGQALEQHGFTLRISDPGFVERTRVLPFVHVASRLPLDVVLAGPGLEDTFFTRAITHDVEGVRIPVASPEDIVVMKLLASRAKDLDDVVSIAAAVEGLDTEYVRRTLGLLEEALGQGDLLPAFERALARARPPRS